MRHNKTRSIQDNRQGKTRQGTKRKYKTKKDKTS